MEMASIELGGYEMRFDLNTVYVTKNFPCSLHLKVSGLYRYFQQMLREFDQTHSHTVWVGHSKVYEISFSDGTIRYIRMETSARAMRRSDLSKILPPLCWNGSA